MNGVVTSLSTGTPKTAPRDHPDLPSLSPLLYEHIVRDALREDLGRAGDITTDSIVPADAVQGVALVCRKDGAVAGLDVAAMAFQLIDPKVVFKVEIADGSRVAVGDVLATIDGPARALLTAERVALNFLSHMSGIATVTRAIADSISEHKAQIICTRKTTPGLRALEKYAVRAGGGGNHRFGLDDGVLIKDNHVAFAGGITPAIERARQRAGHLVMVQVEVDSLEQLREALDLGVHAVLLDNMDVSTLTRAVEMIDGAAIAEASGSITAQSAPAIAATGVDLISAGWLTHSAPALDIGLDVR
jgi:nicotinate-nucleotide pyrophosphorylase (carboxylating)